MKLQSRETCYLPSAPRRIKATGTSVFWRILMHLFAILTWWVSIKAFITQGPHMHDAFSTYLCFAIFGVLGPLVIEYSFHREKRLLRDGREVNATIDAIQGNYKGRVYLQYSFDAEGRRWMGAYGETPASNIGPGDTITVLYQPGKPGNNLTLRKMDMVRLADGRMPQ